MLEYLADGDYLSQLITPETIFWYLIADAAMTGLMAGTFFRIRYVVVFICKKSNVYSYGSYSRVLLFCQLFYKNIWRE